MEAIDTTTTSRVYFFLPHVRFHCRTKSVSLKYSKKKTSPKPSTNAVPRRALKPT